MSHPLATPLATAGLSALANGINAEARRERYRFAHFDRAGCRLLYELLTQAGCTEEDEVYLALVEHMAAHNFSRARRRRVMRRRGAEGGADA